MNEKVSRQMREGLSRLTVSPERHAAILSAVAAPKRRASRFRRALILAILLVLIAATSVAITIYELVKPQMNELEDASLQWDHSTKLRYVALMEEMGFALDEAQLAILRDTTLSEAERGHAADLIIDAVYGEAMRAKQDPSIVQQEEYFAPDSETVFYELYRRADPTAEEASIAAAYEQWCAEYYPPAPTAVPESYVEPTTPASQAELRERCVSYLSEIVNFSKAEREACDITLTFDEENSLWIANFVIEGSELRQALKNEWVTDAYNEATGCYEWSVLYTGAGELIGTQPLAEYLIKTIIPSEAYPGYDEWRDEYRAFLYCSTEERAAFSAAWKPVVDAFLQAHPDVNEYFETTDSFATAYITTRHRYGVPSAEVISEQQAIQIAEAAYLSADVAGVSEDMIANRCDRYTLYDVTDPERPLWKVSHSRKVQNVDPADHANGYFVVIDAKTGEVLRQYEETGYPVENALDFAERYD